MGFYFRKSFGSGPFRVNFSKSGVSYSVGGKGARVNFSNRGTYVSFGSNGLYYRKRISPPRTPRRHSHVDQQVVSYDRHTITSADLEQITDVDSQDFVNELTEKENKISFAKWFGWVPFMIATIGCVYYFIRTPEPTTVRIPEVRYYVLSSGQTNVNVRMLPEKASRVMGVLNPNEQLELVDSSGTLWYKVKFGAAEGFVFKKFTTTIKVNTHREVTDAAQASLFESDPDLFWKNMIATVVIFSLLIYFLKTVDRKRCMVQINYEIDDTVGEVHQKFLEHFSELMGSSRVWQYLHSERTFDYKYSSGAAHTVTRKRLYNISSNKRPSKAFETNVQIPHLGLINTDLFFFPERLIIKRGKQYGAIMYKNVHADRAVTRFIESETVPHDSLVVGHTWKYLNKDGGPDRRFNGNHQIPICNYSEYTFQSPQGLNEKISTSRVGVFDNFVNYVSAIGQLQKRMQHEKIG